MDSFFIINAKTKEVLLFKEFNSKNNKSKVQSFLIELDHIINTPAPSPYVLIDDTFFIYYTTESNDILYLCLVTQDEIIPSLYKILETIDQSLKLAFKNEVKADLIKDNAILILLMIDQFILCGIPLFVDSNILEELVKPYAITDKISEKIIGKAKYYDTKTLSNYIKDRQIYQHVYKYNDEIRSINPKIYFDFNDYIDLSADKAFNILNNSCLSQLEILAEIPKNTPLNMLLNIPYEVLNFTIDDNVLTKKKEIIKKKTIDCLCKHGKNTLISLVPVLKNSFISLPFSIRINNSCVNNKETLSISIDLVSVKDEIIPLEQIKIKLCFPPNFKNNNLTVSHGEFEFEDNVINGHKEATWIIDKIDKSNKNVFLKGNIVIEKTTESNTALSLNSCLFTMSCVMEKYSISGGSLVKVNVPDEEKNIITKFYKNKTVIKCLEIFF